MFIISINNFDVWTQAIIVVIENDVVVAVCGLVGILTGRRDLLHPWLPS